MSWKPPCPDLLAWVTPSYLEEKAGKVKYEGAPDADVGSYEQKLVAFFHGDKYSEILKKDRKFDKKHTHPI